jgi:hypothetical protein
LRLQCQAAPLFIGESQTLAAKHLAQHPDLFFLVRDNRLLVSVDPAREHQRDPTLLRFQALSADPVLAHYRIREAV